MARLIDADGIRKKAVPHTRGEHGYNANIRKWAVLVGDIDDAPTVDAVEVVRCRDCTKNGLFTCPICFIENKTLQFINHSPDFYCGEGERRTDG